jgi:hypothetical protein
LLQHGENYHNVGGSLAGLQALIASIYVGLVQVKVTVLIYFLKHAKT